MCSTQKRKELNVEDDPVNHPAHYNSHPSGVEAIVIAEYMTYNVGSAIKYLWRAGLKCAGDKEKHIEDLKKAGWFINREIQKIQKG